MTDIEKLMIALEKIHPNAVDSEFYEIEANNLMEQTDWLRITEKQLLGLSEGTNVVVPVEPPYKILEPVYKMMDEVFGDFSLLNITNVYKAMLKAAQGDL